MKRSRKIKPRHNRSVAARLFGTAVVLVAAGLVGSTGCASAGKSPRASTAESRGQVVGKTSRERIAASAAREQTGRSPGNPLNVPVPLGVDPLILEPRDPSDPVSRMDLDAALVDVAKRVGEIEAPATRPVDAESSAQALKFYTRGREAAMDNRHLVAVTEFQKALELDPDSPQITRELARSFLKVGNSARAVELFERLSQLDPQDSEALFTVGLALANRREFARSAAVLGKLRAGGQASEHDPVADVLANFTLALALRELGYDQASIDAGLASLDLPDNMTASTDHALRLGSVYRQRGETWRAIGDAYCRLGEYEKALDAYARATSMPSADPAALHSRVIYANLRLGRVFSAQHEVLRALEESAPNISDRDIRLCGYLAEYAPPVDELSRAAVEMYRAQPDDAGLARAAASLLPSEESLALLREFVQRRPRDMEAVRQLLAWLAQRDMVSAVALTVALTKDHPDLGEDYARALAIAVPRVSEAVAACEQLPPSAALARVEARVLAASTAMGQAWTVCEEARKIWPDDPGLRVMQIRLAAALEEPGLLRPLAAHRDELEVAGLIALSQSQRGLGQHHEAVETAEIAVDRHPDGFDALVELARAHAARATALAAGTSDKSPARADSDSAEQFANRAVALDPTSDEPYEVLAAVSGPGGPLADSAKFRQAVQALYAANPNSPLYARLVAQEAIGQRRYDQAIERLANLCENDPSDIQCLRLAVLAWERWNRLEVAEDWLERRLQARPGDASLMEQWVYVMLKQDKSAQALAKLESEHQSHPDDYAVSRLLEQVYRATGHSTEALALGEARLNSRPEGMRREVELTELYLGAKRWDKAAERLEWVRDHAEDGTVEQLSAAASMAARLEDDDERRDTLTLEIVQRGVDVHPVAPLELYGNGLRALARLHRMGEEYDELADRAAANARMATAATSEQIVPWIELAQALVQDEQPEAAARALRARLWSSANPLPDDIAAAIATVAFAADAASPNMVDQSVELARDLDRRGVLKMLSSLDQPTTFSQTLFEVSSMYTLVGNRDGAAQLLTQVIAIQPDHAMAMNNLGYARVVAGHQDGETVQLIERAWEIMPADPNILDTAGWLRYRQGRFTDSAELPPGDRGAQGALGLLQASLDANKANAGAPASSPSPEVLDHLGDTRWRLGDREGAVEAWKRSVAVLEDRVFEERILQGYLLVQTRVWRLLVADPREMYDREFGQVLRRVQAKLQAVEQNREPSVAPTFAEEQAGDANP